jgi:uncharacterized protein YjbI with pentapeptide repeats
MQSIVLIREDLLCQVNENREDDMGTDRDTSSGGEDTSLIRKDVERLLQMQVGPEQIEANLSGARLGRANFWGANLSKVNLTSADLNEADLSGGILNDLQ